MELYELTPFLAAALLLFCGISIIKITSRSRSTIALPALGVGTCFCFIGVVGALILLLLTPFSPLVTKFPSVWSPDRKHWVRALDVDGGATEAFVEVELHTRWHPWPAVVLLTRSDDARNLQFEWMNNSRLVVRYPEGFHDPPNVCTSADDVKVDCESYVRATKGR